MMKKNRADHKTDEEVRNVITEVTFDFGWPWTVLDLGHRILASNISNTVRDTMLDTMEVR